jgi:CDP-glucose 4,6-dehydratase
MLAQKLCEDGPRFSEPWNFGPDDVDVMQVEWVVAKVCALWGGNAAYEIDRGDHPHEAFSLKLDCSKTKSLLRWRPVWKIEKALDRIVRWTRCYQEKQDMQSVCLQEISAYARDSSAVTAERAE